MTRRQDQIIDLLADPICLMLMERDGVHMLDVLALMKEIRPLINRCRRKSALAA